ncbi:Hypothetical protein CINCED_3A007168 [Cinara cedri]|uniref:Uncharacterized protein n=1 Tax=Cinara cedri TaxID=506608 RepID=A0A5E4MHL2_9HEMI|nr:Hypothetical protein CINCED_3A007168 [Cinara cedri]
MTDAIEKINRIDPLVTLETELDKIDYSKFQAESKNVGTSTGQTMYVDFGRIDFVINEKKIDRTLIYSLKEGVQFNKSNSDNIFDNLWKDHYENPHISNGQKTASYKEEFEKFYNIGKELAARLPIANDKNRYYRLFAKEIFKEMFKYTNDETSIPNDAILDELITNCNQGGYIGALYSDNKPYYHLMVTHNLMVNSNPILHINCKTQDNVIVSLNEKVTITPIGIKKKICDFSSSLNFTLESKDGKNITCKDGKFSLAVPTRLKSYNVNNKNFFYAIRDCFQKLCEKFGLCRRKIERSFSQMSESGHLDNIRTPTTLIMCRPRSNTI